MKFNPQKSTFGRHETFPLRYGWLTKAIQTVNKQGFTDIFKQPEAAMIELGLGKNMVNALQYWLQVIGVMNFNEGVAHITDFGEALLGKNGDLFLEDEATIWIIHWRIASNPELATGFFWFFNHFSMPRFKSNDMLHSLVDFAGQELKKRSESTLKSDVSTLLRMYSPTAGRNDEHLDSPMSLLGLLSNEVSGGYLSQRTVRPFLPAVALHFALQSRFAEQSQQTPLPINSLLYGGDGYPAPGAVFRLNEEGLMGALAKVMETYPNCYELRETAGLHQLYLSNPPLKATDLLTTYYQGRAA